MIRNQSRRGNRQAFTLVELMVVILIIAILVSLVSSAVIKTLAKIPEVHTRTEISELAVALQAFMSDYNIPNPPPSVLILNETTPLAPSPIDGGRSAAFLQKVFGKNLGPTDWNGDGQPDGPWVLQGEHALVFYLGGPPSAAGLQGFSTNNMNPAVPGGKRKGPYYNFITSRLVKDPTVGGFFVYLDPWEAKASSNGIGPRPFVYFSSYGINNGYTPTDCVGVTFTDPLGTHYALPYATGPGVYTNSNTYQILSAGRDGKFGYNPGSNPPTNLWSPAAGVPTGQPGADDQANFSSTLLGVGQN
jgi:prepilin-type N-terminal cleavage/methylation domain-containing protein